MQKETGLMPGRAVSKAPRTGASAPRAEDAGVPGSGTSGAGVTGTAASKADDVLFTEDMLAQLRTVFGKMENSLIFELYLDERPVSAELKRYMESLTQLTDKLTVTTGDRNVEYGRPFVRVLKADRTPTGLGFHGVPGGHEFSSFIMGLYNAAGKGQALDDAQLARINDIDNALDLKIMVSLSCTMCPEPVTSAQKIAALNEHISAEVYDINHFGELRDKYNVMSVPCMVANDLKISFGKKNIEQILDWLAV